MLSEIQCCRLDLVPGTIQRGCNDLSAKISAVSSNISRIAEKSSTRDACLRSLKDLNQAVEDLSLRVFDAQLLLDEIARSHFVRVVQRLSDLLTESHAYLCQLATSHTSLNLFKDYYIDIEKILLGPVSSILGAAEPIPSVEQIREQAGYESLRKVLKKLISGHKEEPLTCYISGAPDLTRIQELVIRHLKRAGVVVSSRFDVKPPLRKTDVFEKIASVNHVLVLASLEYGREERVAHTTDLKTEIDYVLSRLETDRQSVTTFLFHGEPNLALPSLFLPRLYPVFDCRDPAHYANHMRELLQLLFGSLPLAESPSEVLSSGVDSSSISGLTLKKLSADLRIIYLSRGTLNRFINQVTYPIAESYFHLAIVLEREQRDKEKKLKECRVSYISQYEALHLPKENIEIADLFSPRVGENANPNHLLVEGRAGIGKTTFCQYLCYLFANSELRERLGPWAERFDNLIWINLRDLHEMVGTLSIGEVVKRQLLSNSQMTSAQIEQLLAECEGRVLYILDGYDEIAAGSEAVHTFVETLINKEHWILTSRPRHQAARIGNPRYLENIGFGNAEIEKFTRSFFKDEAEKAEALMQEINAHPYLYAMAHIPIILEILCGSFEEDSSLFSAGVTLTTLYETLASDLIRRYLHRIDPSQAFGRVGILATPAAIPVVSALESIARRAMEKSSLVLSEIDYAPVLGTPPNPNLCDALFSDVGFLKPTGQPRERHLQEYYFIHLTFQEYFAARALVSELIRGDASSVTAHKFNPRFTLLFAFTAGILSQSSEKLALNLLFNSLLDEPHSLLGLHETLLAARCLEEAGLSSDLPAKAEIIRRLRIWLQPKHIEKEAVVECIASYLTGCRGLFEEEGLKSPLAICFSKNRSLTLAFCARLAVAPSSIASLILARLSDPNSNVRWSATKALLQLGVKERRVLDALIATLSDPDSYFRLVAAEATGQLGVKESPVLDALIARLSDRDSSVRQAAAMALGQLGVKESPLLDALIARLSDTKSDVREAAAKALWQLGVKERPVLDALIACLSDQESSVRGSAALAIGQLGVKESPVLDALIARLSDQYSLVKGSAALAIGQLGIKESRALDPLIASLSDRDSSVKRASAKALGQLGVKESPVLDALIARLLDRDSSVRGSAAYALGQLGAKERPVLDALIARISDQESSVRYAAAYVLGNLRVKKIRLLNALIACLSDQESEVRGSAAKALGQLGVKESRVLDALIARLSDQENDVRGSAAYALGQLGVKESPVLDALIACLTDQESSVRGSAAKALGQLGVKESRVLDSLIASLLDQESDVRGSAAIALASYELSYLFEIRFQLRISRSLASWIVATAPLVVVENRQLVFNEEGHEQRKSLEKSELNRLQKQLSKELSESESTCALQ